MIEIKAVPGSKKRTFSLDKAGNIKCYLKSQPEKGQANEELIRFLSKVLEIPCSDISITHGATSRFKRIKIITNKSYDAILSELGIEKQMSIFGAGNSKKG